VSWGLVSAAMMFATGPISFYALRVLLGVAEAGFFPGIILYLSQWFPAEARARAIAKFMIAGLVASILGNPISGAVLQYTDEVAGLHGWQWLFLLEGIPAVLLGFVTYHYLTDRPELAQWLTPAEREWLIARLAAEQQTLHGHERGTFRAALVDPRVWLLIGVYFTVAVGDNCYGFFVQTVIKDQFPDYKEFQIGLLAAIPSVIATVVMIASAMHSDYTGERRGHVACAAFAAAIGWVLLAVAPSPWLFIAALAVTSSGMKSMLPTFWTLPTSMLSGVAAAGGIALINSVANIGGFLGPFAFGALGEKYESFTLAMLIVAAILAGGAMLVLFAPRGASKSK
jgi:ACS family tartrate transporter-like MFS transporter